MQYTLKLLGSKPKHWRTVITFMSPSWMQNGHKEHWKKYCKNTVKTLSTLKLLPFIHGEPLPLQIKVTVIQTRHVQNNNNNVGVYSNNTFPNLLTYFQPPSPKDRSAFQSHGYL